MLDGNTPCATLTICDENVTSFAIDTNEMSKAFGGIGSFCGSSSLIHGFNDGVIRVESGAINEFSFVVNICNGCRLGQIQCAVLCMFPMQIAMEIMLSCIIRNILRGILEESVKWFPCENTSRPEHFQIESRTKISLVVTSQWASMCSDAFEGASLQ